MKKLVYLFLFTLAALLFFPKVSLAQEEGTLFWGVNCPYCHTLKERIDREGLREKVNIVEVELQENAENISLFKEKIAECKINPERAGIPLLFAGKNCYQGVDQIIGRLNEMVNGSSAEVEPIEKMDLSKGKANTEKMIVIVFFFLLALILFGYYRQGLKKREYNVKKEKKRRSKVSVVLFFLLGPLFFASKTYAICPLCTIAVGAGVGFSRSLGIDDVIVGLWIGGLIVSSCMWLIEFIKGKKIIGKKWCKWWLFVIVVSMYSLALVPLKLSGVIGHPLNTILGVDKVLFGVLLGSIVFFTSGRLHFFLKKRNVERNYIPYQKVIIPVGALWLATIFLYLMVYY